MEAFEIIIYKLITNSAKKRFDYDTFQEIFPKNPNIGEVILSKVIAGFAVGKEIKDISFDINQFLLECRLTATSNQIEAFVIQANDLFNLEIFAAKVSIDMFNKGQDESSIYHSVSEILNGRFLFNKNL